MNARRVMTAGDLWGGGRKACGAARETAENDARLNDAADEVVAARALGAELQLQTVAAGDLKARAVEHKAIEVGRDGATRVERSTVTALFNRNSNAVVRLWADGFVDDPGMRAALSFASALDRVFGAFRVRTINWDRVSGLGADGLNAMERDAQARGMTDDAKAALGDRLFMMMNLVMRYDYGSAEAAAEIYKKRMSAKKLTGMGDSLLIEGADRLAVCFGYVKALRPFDGGPRRETSREGGLTRGPWNPRNRATSQKWVKRAAVYR